MKTIQFHTTRATMCTPVELPRSHIKQGGFGAIYNDPEDETKVLKLFFDKDEDQVLCMLKRIKDEVFESYRIRCGDMRSHPIDVDFVMYTLVAGAFLTTPASTACPCHVGVCMYPASSGCRPATVASTRVCTAVDPAARMG
jgi:hypothetical protein